MKHDTLTTIRCTDPEFSRVQARRRALMQARAEAITRRDWAAMNDITIKLAKLPTTMGGR